MQFHPRRFSFVALLFVIVTGYAAEATIGGHIGSNSTTTSGATATETKKKNCELRCDSDNGKCNSDVRRGRQECSRKASNGGNNPFTGRPDEYDYYCGYFHFDHCAAYGGNTQACAGRFATRYAECVSWMRGNIAAQRFDCYKAENKATNLCRAELADCKKQCVE